MYSYLLDYQGKHLSEEVLAVLLGHLAKENLPLPGEWAVRLAEQDDRSKRSVVLKRTPAELVSLFLKRYEENFGGKLSPKLGGSSRKFHYRPASPTLASGYGREAVVPPAEWPTVVGWRRQFGGVVRIYNDCIEGRCINW